MKWTIIVGTSFKKDQKYFIPVKIIGEPERSRSTIVSYLMNLEMLKISKDIDRNFEFESIWPFILYLFNNWVRYQVRLMGIVQSRPELKNKLVDTEPTNYEVLQFDKDINEDNNNYNEILNFSSEIEYDD